MPKVDEDVKDLSEYSGEEILRGSETILIVDDDESVRNLAWKILEKQGYQVFSVKNQIEALSFSKEFKSPIHLTLTGVVIPSTSGTEVIDELKKVRNDFKVLYM